jgi:DNA uptake protein ComE-like DNA-binding protein
MPRLPNIVASGAFTVKNPTIDLARLVDKEFYIRGEEIKQFEIEELPAKPNDRRAALGRGDIPMFSYKQRIGTGPNGERKTVSAPIDLLPILSNQRNLFVSSIVSHVSLEQEIEAVLIACQGFNMLPGNSKLHANRRLADLIKSLGAAYMKSGIRSRDINGLSANRTTLELKEFMMHSGLATFRLIAHKIGVVDEDVTTKVIDMIDKLSDESFLSVVDKAIAIAASKV